MALSGDRFLGVGDEGVFLIRPEGNRFVAQPIERLSMRVLHAVADGEDGTILIHGFNPGGKTYRVRIEGDQMVRLDSSDQVVVRSPVSDGSGGIVFYTDGRGRLGSWGVPDERGSRDRPHTPILQGRAEAMMFDYEGSLWIGTFGNGAYRLRGEHLRTLTTTPATRITLSSEGDGLGIG